MTRPRRGRRITQREIAQLTGVSQSVVSLVLNGKADEASRIPARTRERVARAIAETGYTADPAARRLAGVDSKIIGVFTYEPAFPTEAQDFYTPLLAGIEAEAEVLGCDLLMFTSAPVRDGRRQLLRQNDRLRFADGCLLLGVRMDADELATLLDDGYPFVAVGRRDVPRVPFVGVDYVSGAAALVEQVLAAGHTSVAYLALQPSGESIADRLLGVRRGCESSGARLRVEVVEAEAIDGTLVASLVEDGVTAVVAETPALAEQLWHVAEASGLHLPADLSVALLADPPRRDSSIPALTRLRPPRTQLGAESLRLLGRILDPDDRPRARDRARLLPCEVVQGGSVVPPRASSRRARGRARPR